MPQRQQLVVRQRALIIVLDTTGQSCAINTRREARVRFAVQAAAAVAVAPAASPRAGGPVARHACKGSALAGRACTAARPFRPGARVPCLRMPAAARARLSSAERRLSHSSYRQEECPHSVG